jgi:hypothetical protein
MIQVESAGGSAGRCLTSPIASLAISLATAFAPSVARAQDAWPSRSITFIVPYAAGGYTDVVGRLVARHVETALGKPVIIVNRAGAGGIVGTQAVASAVPDGYVFCVCSVGAISIAPFAQKVGYDPRKDLAPVGIVSSIPQTVIVRKDLPVKTLADLIVREGQSRQTELRLQRRRWPHALFRRALPGPHRHQRRPHPVSGRRGIDCRRDFGRNRFRFCQPH